MEDRNSNYYYFMCKKKTISTRLWSIFCNSKEMKTSKNKKWTKESPSRFLIVVVLQLFLLTCIPLVVFKGTFPLTAAEPNLLQFPPKSTSRPKLAAARTLLPIVPKSNRRKSSGGRVIMDFQNIKFFVQFLVAYSNSKRWTSAQLLFPSADVHLCRFLQVSLLREAGLSTSCHHSDDDTTTAARNSMPISDPRFQQDISTTKLSHNTPRYKKNRWIRSAKGDVDTKNNTHQRLAPLIKTSWDAGGEPLIACHFLTLSFPANQTGRVNVNPRLLINYRADMDVLVVAGNYESTEKIIDELQPEINTNYRWTLASRMNESHMNIEDIYGLATSSLPLRNPFGLWSHDSGLFIDHHKLAGPTNFQGKVIRVTTIEGQPVVYLQQSSDGTFQAMGYLPDILLSISSQLNFNFQLFPPADKSFGLPDDKGNFSGMVGQLQRKEVDLALMSFSYTTDRKAVMSFSPPVEYSATRLLVRQDRQNDEVNWLAYLEPFEWKIWLAIPLTISLGVITFLAFSHFKVMEATPGQSAWLLSLCILQQGQEEHTLVSAFPGRIVLGSFWILAVVLYSSYTAKITSSLAAVTDQLQLHSLGEAVSNHNWKISLVKGSSVEGRVKGSEMPEMVKMWKRIQKDSTGLVSGFREGIDRVYNERLVFFTSDLIPSFLVKENCSYTWVPGRFFPGFGYMGYQKNLPYADSISHEVAKLRQSGQMKRLFTKWWGVKENSCSIYAAGFVRMSLYKTGTAFIVLISGALLSVVFVLVEFCVHLKKPPDEIKINEEQSLPPQFSASTNSSQFSTKELVGGGGVNDAFRTKNTHNPQKENSNKGFFLRLATPFHYFLYPQRNSSMSKNWNTSEKPGNPLTLNF